MDTPSDQVPAPTATVVPETPRPVSHTSDNPQPSPHTFTNKSTIASPEPFIRIFLLAWAVRYVPRGLLGEIFSSNTISAIRKPVTKFIDHAVVNRLEGKINQVMAEEAVAVATVKKNPDLLRSSDEGAALYTKLKPIIRGWRGDASKEARQIITSADMSGATPTVSAAAKSSLREMARKGMVDGGYSLSLFVGSSALSLNYSRLVRNDIKNIFSEAVAYEKDVPQDQITFNDITASDNRIVQGTVKNYHKKLVERLGSDSLFLLSTPLKSGSVTDLLLGFKGLQMFRDTWRRNPTLFEDLVTFVNNKINPTNGLGQPVSIGEVFDLYQHYAQAYTPNKAFVGVIEHAKSEGARWSENQVIFHRLTDLINKTYAYKHKSIVDDGSGLTVLQADFALPKFIYLLGHDLIDVTQPKRTQVTIEVANSFGIPAVKEMQRMMKEGQSLEQVMQRYPVILPDSLSAASRELSEVVTPKAPPAPPLLDQSQEAASITDALLPANKIAAQTIVHAAPQPQHEAISI